MPLFFVTHSVLSVSRLSDSHLARTKKSGFMPLFFVTHSVLSVGIEPTLHPPQGCVLSIERRERCLRLYRFCCVLATLIASGDRQNFSSAES